MSGYNSDFIQFNSETINSTNNTSSNEYINSVHNAVPDNSNSSEVNYDCKKEPDSIYDFEKAKSSIVDSIKQNSMSNDNSSQISSNYSKLDGSKIENLDDDLNLLCKVHKKRFTKYCTDCQINICNECKSKHEDHSLKRLTFQDKDFEKIKEKSQKVEEIIKGIDNYFSYLKNVKDNFIEQYKMLFNRANSYYNDYILNEYSSIEFINEYYSIKKMIDKINFDFDLQNIDSFYENFPKLLNIFEYYQSNCFSCIRKYKTDNKLMEIDQIEKSPNQIEKFEIDIHASNPIKLLTYNKNFEIKNEIVNGNIPYINNEGKALYYNSQNSEINIKETNGNQKKIVANYDSYENLGINKLVQLDNGNYAISNQENKIIVLDKDFKQIGNPLKDYEKKSVKFLFPLKNARLVSYAESETQLIVFDTNNQTIIKNIDFSAFPGNVFNMKNDVLIAANSNNDIVKINFNNDYQTVIKKSFQDLNKGITTFKIINGDYYIGFGNGNVHILDKDFNIIYKISTVFSKMVLDILAYSKDLIIAITSDSIKELKRICS